MHIATPNEAVLAGPDVTWSHVDGPLLHWAGNIHWLTIFEWVRIFVRISTVDEVACKRWPHLAKAREALQPN